MEKIVLSYCTFISLEFNLIQVSKEMKLDPQFQLFLQNLSQNMEQKRVKITRTECPTSSRKEKRYFVLRYLIRGKIQKVIRLVRDWRQRTDGGRRQTLYKVFATFAKKPAGSNYPVLQAIGQLQLLALVSLIFISVATMLPGSDFVVCILLLVLFCPALPSLKSTFTFGRKSFLAKIVNVAEFLEASKSACVTCMLCCIFLEFSHPNYNIRSRSQAISIHLRKAMRLHKQIGN